MLFNSYEFLLFFLPFTWCIYYILNHIKWYRVAQSALVIASFVFYGYEDYHLCFVLLGTILVNYLIHFLFLEKIKSGWQRKILLVFGICANFGLLFYFKYFNFLLDNLNRFAGGDFAMKNIVMPLGISFFTFQQVSFVVDSFKGEVERVDFLDYALFISFFPQLVAGPIVLHKEMLPQFRDISKKKLQYGNLIAGLEYLIIGFAKKVLIADSFARICDAGYAALSELNSVSALLTMLAFTLQIYFDFSGYCDMAIGLGKLFNIEIPLNFDSPYRSLTIAEFWKRWHMTLTRFLTSYLYIPLGGNRKGKICTYVNVMIVFTLSGLWHGAQWTFVLWGMLHGLMMVIYRMGKNVWDRLPKVFLWLCTFLFVNAAWVFFRADYFRQPFRLFERMLFGGSGLCMESMVNAFCEGSVWMTLLEVFVPLKWIPVIGQITTGLWFLVWTIGCVCLPSSHEMVKKQNRSTRYFIYLGILLAWSFMWLSQVSKFIYFNF